MKCLRSDNAGCLVISVAIARDSVKPGNHDVRLLLLQDLDYLSNQSLLVPVLESLVQPFGKAKVLCACEPKPHAVVASRGQRLLRSDSAECIVHLRTSQVGTSFSARQRKQEYVVAVAATERGEESRILIIRMRHDVHDPQAVPCSENCLPRRRRSAIPGLGGMQPRKRQRQQDHEGTHGHGEIVASGFGILTSD